MSHKKIMQLTFFLVIVFILPIIFISLFSNYSKSEFYSVEEWSANIVSCLNSETLKIIVNNLIVFIGMFLFAIIPSLIYQRKERTESDFMKLIQIITVSYCMYFMKEGIRAGLSLLYFPYVSYWIGVFIFILPHGFLEISGLALASSVILEWHRIRSYTKTTFHYLLISACMIILAGILETTLTPYIIGKLYR